MLIAYYISQSIIISFKNVFQIDNDDICAAVQSCLFDWLDGFAGKYNENGENDSSTLLEACVLAYAEHVSVRFFILHLINANLETAFFSFFLEIAQMSSSGVAFFGKIIPV